MRLGLLAGLTFGAALLSACDKKPGSGEVLQEPAVGARAALENGLAWLMAQQGEDGGWHSETYGSMKSGAALTALAIHAVAQAPDEIRSRFDGQLRQGWEFLRTGLEKTGCIAAPDGSLDYPVYASALILSAAHKVDFGITASEQDALLEFLLKSQVVTGEESDPHDGGWNFRGAAGGEVPLTDTNISVTRFALEALGPRSDREGVHAARERARWWLVRAQNLGSDGGFFFHTERDHPGNKAEWTAAPNPEPRSYGTCTADGWRGLQVAGSEAELRDAEEWLIKNEGLAAVPGFSTEPSQKGWPEGLRYYYWASLSALPDRVFDRDELLGLVLGEQLGDGQWANDSSRMREDDPVIATCFALMTLAQLMPDAAE